MFRSSNVGALLRVGSMVVMFVGVQALALPVPPPAHSAGCHEHGGTVPAPSPASYQCCVEGHHAAIPGGTFTPPALVVPTPHARSEFLTSATGSYFVVSTVPSHTPPGIAPLRI